MPKSHKYIIPDKKDWPIYKLDQDRSSFIAEVNKAVFEQLIKNHGSDIEALLEKTVYLERIRVKTNPWKVDPADEAKYWMGIAQKIKKASLAEDKEHFNTEILKRIINRYAEEIVGSWKPKTHRFALNFLTKLFRRLLNTFTGKENRWIWGSREDLFSKIHVSGYVQETKDLFQKGTVVMVPTHFSNLDSIMIGYILDRMMGLPSFAFAAGLNLYDVEIFAYFMNRLGAYRVDRRKKNPIYLECLKAVTNLQLQRGVNNIFFPGGTRSREGSIESKLKLGLLGSVVEAQRSNFEKDTDQKIFVVPVVMGYPFVLEAKSLITQYLRRTGKEKYIHSRDKLSKIKKTYRFIKHLYGRGSEIYLSVGTPMDVMGNPVDKEGRSVDERGQEINLRNYFVSQEDQVEENSQRESVYTRILGDKIVESFFKNNEVLSPHLMAYLTFQYVRRSNPDLSIYNIFNLKPSDILIPMEDMKIIMSQAIEVLHKWESEEKIKLTADIRMPVDQVINAGIRKLGVFHPEKALYMDKHGNIKTEDLKLLFYYHNRMRGYHLDENVKWDILKMEEV